MENWIAVISFASIQASLLLAIGLMFRKQHDQLICELTERQESDREWLLEQQMKATTWWGEQLDHEWALNATRHVDALAKIDRSVEKMDSHIVETLSAYHEMRLLPSLTLLASQQVSCAPPEPVEEKPQVVRVRPQISDDIEVQNIWDKVRAAY